MSAFFGRLAMKFQNELNNSSAALLGIIQGVLADGHLNDSEILFLRDWLSNNETIASAWPGNVLCTRIEATLEDGQITKDEREHLVATLQQIVGGTLQELAESGHVSALALDDVTALDFQDHRFCLTGDFVFGPRNTCERAIEMRGGAVASAVSKKIRYLVVGGLGSSEWKHGSFGTKIERAIELKQNGFPLFIVHEDVWASSLNMHPTNPTPPNPS
jgi:hypothetical protein